MKLLITLIDWEYPANRAIPTSELWELNDHSSILSMVLTMANGTIVEMRVEAPSEEELTSIRKLIEGTGNGRLTALSSKEIRNLWLYQEGDDCYIQGSDAYIFVNPVPQPDKFSCTLRS